MLRSNTDRRRFLVSSSMIAAGTIGASLWIPRKSFAEQLAETPPMTEGPFYPDHLPLDTDNDLIIISNSITPAVGTITQLSGRILSKNGTPIKNATVEIWQCDANQVYLHSRDSKPKADQQDKNFQGFGRFETNSEGEYRFRTIKPVVYPGRPAPHIHYKIKLGDRELLTTQLMIRGFEGNEKDGIFRNASKKFDSNLFQADFLPIPDSKSGELFAKFDLIVGMTPQEEQLKPTESKKDS